VVRRAIATLVLLAGMSLACAGSTFAPTRVDGGAGSVTAIAHWQIQSSAKAQESGAKVSSPGFSTDGWYPVSGRATVMAGLLENGKYENVFYSDNLRAVEEPDASGTMFVIPWWYRTQFIVADGAQATYTFLRINGMIPSADVWLNGQLIAEHSAVAGAYPVRELDVTRWVHVGTNTLALRVHPGDPRTSLSIGWVDWNPTPPDNNMGPWRGVEIVRTGPVQIRFPHVTSALALPDLARAALTVKLEARNLDTSAHEATIAGVVAGISLRRTIHLAPGETQTVLFSPKSDPALDLRHPQVWWPVGMGAHPLYRLQMSAAVNAPSPPTSPSRVTFSLSSTASLSSYVARAGLPTCFCAMTRRGWRPSSVTSSTSDSTPFAVRASWRTHVSTTSPTVMAS
jgi:exo-1,4-beta-D-glucosaminidase